MEWKADHYQTLGVSRDAEAHEIRRAFRRSAKELHPDGGGEDDRGFSQITEAYRELRDSVRRRRYDQELRGREGVAGPSQWVPHSDLDAFAADAGWGLSHLFDLFGGVVGAQQWWHEGVRRSTDVHMDLELSPREAAYGVSFSLDITEQDLAAGVFFGDYPVRHFTLTIPVSIPAGVRDWTTFRFSFVDGDATSRILQLTVRIVG
ncbi:MAG: hypothetical protein EA403_16980 [Spirochaetaceae bacterium]|nr:MAG: hypothetical protein EA403_16980 [Spirochaetaceae bacterium]